MRNALPYPRPNEWETKYICVRACSLSLAKIIQGHYHASILSTRAFSVVQKKHHKQL